MVRGAEWRETMKDRARVGKSGRACASFGARRPARFIKSNAPLSSSTPSASSLIRTHNGKDRGSKGPAPLTSLYIEANMNVISRSIVGKMV